jgi:TPR repeat protein
VDKDPAEAARLFALAAEQGLADAQYSLGEGLSTACCSKQIGQMYHAACTFSDVNIGVAYGNGTGVGKDPVQAAAQYKLAADQGHAIAQRTLGEHLHVCTVSQYTLTKCARFAQGFATRTVPEYPWIQWKQSGSTRWLPSKTKALRSST